MEELRRAEERASQAVARARAERTDKLRGAKAEAARIVEEYKRQKDAEYDQAVRKFNEDLGDQSRLTGDKTNEEIQKMNKTFNVKKAQVEQMLYDAVAPRKFNFAN